MDAPSTPRLTSTTACTRRDDPLRRSLGASPSPENFTLLGGGGGGRYLTRSCLRAFPRSLAKKRPPPRSVVTPDASLLHLFLSCLFFLFSLPLSLPWEARAFSVYLTFPDRTEYSPFLEIARERTRRDATDDTLVNGRRDPPPRGKNVTRGLRAETLPRISRRAVALVGSASRWTIHSERRSSSDWQTLSGGDSRLTTTMRMAAAAAATASGRSDAGFDGEEEGERVEPRERKR